MERRGHRLSLTHNNRVLPFRGEHFHARSHFFNLRRTDEYHLNRRLLPATIAKLTFANGAIDLPSVSIASDSNVQRSESSLLRILNILCQQDRSRTCPKCRLQAHEFLQLLETFFPEKFQERAGFPSRDHQAFDF